MDRTTCKARDYARAVEAAERERAISRAAISRRAVVLQRVLEDLVEHVTDGADDIGEYYRDDACYEVFVTAFIHAMERSLDARITGRQVVSLWSIWLGFHGDDGPPEIMQSQYEIGAELRLAFDAYRSTP